ncbi:MAG: dUTP diphosphatase, partial [Pseudomonadota bacterium]
MPHGTDLALPAYETAGAAGMDLRAAIPAGAPVMLAPGAQIVVPTGIAIALPAGLEAQVRPRSGLARKFGIFIPNAPGTIDSDYTGEIQVILARHGAPGSAADYEIKRGDRVAQLIVAPVVRVSWREVSTLTP